MGAPVVNQQKLRQFRTRRAYLDFAREGFTAYDRMEKAKIPKERFLAYARNDNACHLKRMREIFCSSHYQEGHQETRNKSSYVIIASYYYGPFVISVVVFTRSHRKYPHSRQKRSAAGWSGTSRCPSGVSRTM